MTDLKVQSRKLTIPIPFALKFGIVFYIVAIALIYLFNLIARTLLDSMHMDIGQTLSIVEIIPSVTLSAWVTLSLTAKRLNGIVSAETADNCVLDQQSDGRFMIPIGYAFRFGIIFACGSLVLIWLARYPLGFIIGSIFGQTYSELLMQNHELTLLLLYIITVPPSLILSVKCLIAAEAEKLREILCK